MWQPREVCGGDRLECGRLEGGGGRWPTSVRCPSKGIFLKGLRGSVGPYRLSPPQIKKVAASLQLLTTLRRCPRPLSCSTSPRWWSRTAPGVDPRRCYRRYSTCTCRTSRRRRICASNSHCGCAQYCWRARRRPCCTETRTYRRMAIGPLCYGSVPGWVDTSWFV
jgi:hypothetical protein